MKIKVIQRYSKKSGGKAIINGKIYHHVKGRWIYCADCNKRKGRRR